MWKYSFISLLIVVHLSANAQENIYEEVLLQTSGDRFVSGDRILFHALVRSKATGKLSNLSSILYVELLDDAQKPILQSKVKIENGQGAGDFFITSLIESGSYQLVAYTGWMKNFGDYYHVPISIYNPFEEYTSTPLEDAKMNFHPESGSLVAGVKNKVVVRYTNHLLEGIDFKAKIVDDVGNTLADIASKKGMATFYLTPDAETQYRMVYEEAFGDFKFINLPMACKDCIGISVVDVSGSFVLKVSRQQAASIENKGILKIRDRYKVYLQESLGLDKSIIIEKKNIPSGLYSVEYFDTKGKMQANRLFYNGQIASPSLEKIRSKQRTMVELPWQHSDNIVSSIVVKPKESIISSPALNKLNSQLISLPLRSDLVDQANIDDWLILSKVGWPEWLLIDTVATMPEYRNDLLEGVIRAENGANISNQIVVFSIPGKAYEMSLATTDPQGKFLLNIEEVSGDKEGYIRVLDFEGTEYQVEMNSEFYSEYPNFENWPLRYDSLTVVQIQQESIGLQIENAYEHLKKDAMLYDQQVQYEILNFKNYHLDEYTRFPTMRDVFIELIPEVSVSKSDQKYDLRINWPEALTYFKQSGSYLVLFDGILASPKEVLEYSPYNISDIQILGERYYIGAAMFDGIISLKTKDGDLYGFKPQGTKYNYKGLQRQKIYFSPDHDQPKEMRIPDRRKILSWQFRDIAHLNQKLGFYTSDVVGTFEVLMTGIGPSGELVQEIRTLVVE